MLSQCAILAGGLGTRIRVVEPTLPKSLLPVGGRPFIAWQLEWLASEGIDDVVLCVGHMSDKIRRFVGRGGAWGLEVTYVDEGCPLRGTGGALRHAVDVGALGPEAFVVYGDSYLLVKLDLVYEAFVRAHPAAIMSVLRNENQWQASNVVVRDGLVTDYTKRSPGRRGFEFIDYGLSIWSGAAIEELIPSRTTCDLGEAIGKLASQGRLAAFEVHDRFYEVGSPEGLRDFERHVAGGAGGD